MQNLMSFFRTVFFISWLSRFKDHEILKLMNNRNVYAIDAIRRQSDNRDWIQKIEWCTNARNKNFFIMKNRDKNNVLLTNFCF
jgi:hypothetical protein